MTIKTPPPPPMRMRSYLQRIATGPELSKPLNREAAFDAMQMILERRVSEVQAAIYLIALRMKRETDDENLGGMDAFINMRAEQKVDCEQLLDIAEPFNGYARGLPATPFLPPLLAACGLNSYTHGLRGVGPKFGITPHLVYAAAGMKVDLSPAAAAARIADAEVGWAYLDQAQYFPKLHALINLRAQMVKRSCITTLEVLAGPLRARGRTDLLSGYVHKAYPPVYISLARAAGFDGALIVRGVEGGCIPSLAQPAKLFSFGEGDGGGGGDDGIRETKVSAAEININHKQRGIALPAEFSKPTPPNAEATAAGAIAEIDAIGAAEYCAELGNRALAADTDTAGETGMMRDALIYAAAICLANCGIAADLRAGAELAVRALKSGAAHARWRAALLT